MFLFVLVLFFGGRGGRGGEGRRSAVVVVEWSVASVLLFLITLQYDQSKFREGIILKTKPSLYIVQWSDKIALPNLNTHAHKCLGVTASPFTSCTLMHTSFRLLLMHNFLGWVGGWGGGGGGREGRSHDRVGGIPCQTRQ